MSNNKLVNATKAIGFLRTISIALSFVPLVTFAVIAACVGMGYDLTLLIAMSVILVAIAALAIRAFFHPITSNIVARTGLCLLTASTLICLLSMVLNNFDLITLSCVLFGMGTISFAWGTPLSLTLRLCHTIYYVLVALCAVLYNSFQTETVAVIALSLIVYPMVTSYLTTSWAGKQFFDITNHTDQ